MRPSKLQIGFVLVQHGLVWVCSNFSLVWPYLLSGLGCTKEDWYKGEPDDAGGVHGEADWLCFIESLWDTTTLHCIYCTCYLATQTIWVIK